jgi:hypothetical protein
VRRGPVPGPRVPRSPASPPIGDANESDEALIEQPSPLRCLICVSLLRNRIVGPDRDTEERCEADNCCM